MERENVKMISLLTGEIVIGEIINDFDEDGFVEIGNPAILVPNSQGGAQLQSYNGVLPYDGDTIAYTLFAIKTLPVKPAEELLNGYSQAFGSGIIVASANQIPANDPNTLN